MAQACFLDCVYPNDYIVGVYTVILTPTFEKWFSRLKDRAIRLRLGRRIDRASRGNLGDVKPVGNGVYEMREFFGPGWRIYYIIKGELVLVLLCGGDKSSQQEDIAKAQAIAATWQEE